MDPTAIVMVCVGVVFLLMLPFILAVNAFKPLILSIADRIAGRKTGSQELRDLKQKVLILENELDDLKSKLLSLEYSHDFSNQILEDIHKKSTTEMSKVDAEQEPAS